METEEIENFIKGDECVDECVAIPYSRSGNNIYSDIFLFIKIIQKKDKNYFYNLIAKKLPKYMEPTNIYVQYEDFPRNLNSKIDKKKLLQIILQNIA